jgi:hypothetical protein
MTNPRLILVGTLVALCFGAQPVAAGTYDIALKLTASTYQVRSNGTFTVKALASNNGPGTGGIFIFPSGFNGLSVNSVQCNAVSSDGDFCEYSGVVAGQRLSATYTLTADPINAAADAWTVICSSTDFNQARDPNARNDCAIIAVRVLP